MSRYKYLIIIITCIFLFYNNVNAKNSFEELYKNFHQLSYNLTIPDNFDDPNNDTVKLMDCAIEIIKKDPQNAYSVVLGFPTELRATLDSAEKYKQLKIKYISDLNNPDIDSAEKLFFMFMSVIYPMRFEEDHIAGKNEEYKLCIKGLEKMKDECKNLDYSALATLALFSHKFPEKDYRMEFIQKYPNHPAIPAVKQNIIDDYIFKGEYNKCIEETQKLMAQYEGVMYPEGYPFEVTSYEILALCYLEIQDNITAKKYFDLIKKKDPNNPQINVLSSYFNNNEPTINLKKNIK